MLYSNVGSAGVTLTVPVVTPQLGAVVIAITGAAGAVAAAIVTGALAGEIHVLSVVLLAITVYGPPTAMFGNTPLATHVVPPSMLYSNVGSAGVTLTVPVVTPQLGAVVIAITGAAGAAAAATVTGALAGEIQVLSVVLLAITV
jgi:hypothetical protein